MKKELSKKKIEEISVNKVEDLCNNFARLDAFIDSNDKTPSIDGQIIVRSRPSERKEDIMDFITVQVKGTQVTKLSLKEVSFDVDIADLKNYLLYDGIMFFVVEIINNQKFRIFYNSLLPYDIQVLLNSTKKGQKQKRIKLKKIETSKFFKICNTFILNKNEQKGVPCIPNEDIQKLEDFKLPISNYLKNGLNYLFNNDMYLKAYQPERKQYIIANKMRLISFDKKNNTQVCVNNTPYYETFIEKYKKDGKLIIIGKGIEIPIDKKGNIENISFTLQGKISERIKDIEFLLAWESHKKMTISNLIFEIFPDETHRKKLLEVLKNLQEVKSLFEYLNVNSELDLDNLTLEDNNKIKRLINTIFYNKSEIKCTAPIQSMKVKISNVNIAIVVSNEAGIQKVYNYYDLHNHLKTTVSDTDGNTFFIPVYNELDAKMWMTFDNFRIESYEESIKMCPLSEYALDQSTIIYLEMLKCYDLTGEKQYLNCCENTIKFLRDSYPDNQTVIINYYQTLKRIRPLLKEEKQYLLDLRQKTTDYCSLACISIILDNQSDYEFYYDNLDEETKILFKKWPIYNLVNKNIVTVNISNNEKELIKT